MERARQGPLGAAVEVVGDHHQLVVAGQREHRAVEGAVRFGLGNHGVVLGPCPDNGPYGYLTMGVLAVHPWPVDEALPSHELDLSHWIRVRVEI
jgi:hypothetical protein